MSFASVNLRECIGTEVYTDPASRLNPDVAPERRKLLVQRGVLVFSALRLTDEQQFARAAMMGKLREEGDGGIYKIALDNPPGKRLSPRMDAG